MGKPRMADPWCTRGIPSLGCRAQGARLGRGRGGGAVEANGARGEAMYVGQDVRATSVVGPQFSRVLELFLLYAEAFCGAPVRRHWHSAEGEGLGTRGLQGRGAFGPGRLLWWEGAGPGSFLWGVLAQEASSGFLPAFLVPRGHQPPALGSTRVSCLYILHRTDGCFYVVEVQYTTVL